MTAERKTPRTEHASDLWTGAALEEHYSRPWAMVGRVECEATRSNGEPAGNPGEVIVRYVNADAHDAPEMLGASLISLVVGHPFVEQRGPAHAAIYAALGGAMLEPSTTRALALFLLEAADRAEGTVPDGSLAMYLARALLDECADRAYTALTFDDDTVVVARDVPVKVTFRESSLAPCPQCGKPCDRLALDPVCPPCQIEATGDES